MLVIVMRSKLSATIGGKWQILDYNLDGELTCIPDTGEITLVIHYVDYFPFKKFQKFNKVSDIKEIWGVTSFRQKCVLLECQFISDYSFNADHELTIKAKYLIWDMTKVKDEEIKFNKMSFRLTNSLLWSGMQCYNSFKKDDKYLISCDFGEKIIKSDLKTEIKFCATINSIDEFMRAEKIELYQYLEVIIKKSELTHYTEFLEDIKKVINLIKLATNEEVNINEICGYRNDKTYVCGDKKYYYEFCMVTNEMRNNILSYCDDTNYLYSLPNMISEGKIEVWFKTYNDYKNVYELYLLSYKDEVSSEISFIYLVQALELLHRIKFKNKNKFMKYLKNKLQDKKELWDNIRENSDQEDSRYIILRSRLIDMIDCDFEIKNDFKEETIIKLADIITNSRNYYTHFSESKKEKCVRKKSLSYVMEILRYFIKCYALKELGFDINYINEKTESSLEYIRYYNMIEKILSENGD